MPRLLQGPLQRSSLALWLLAPALLGLSLYRPFTPSSGRAAGLPATVAGFTLVEDRPMTPRQMELLGTGDAAWRVYREEATGQHVFVVAVFHQENWKSVHPPHICLEGSDMAIVRDDVVELALDDGARRKVGRIEAHHRPQGADYSSLYLYGAGGLVTPSYSEFFLHHAPAAILRRPIRGFLLRVETYLDPARPGAAQASAARCMAALLPAAQAALAEETPR